jgi:TRAP-type C4-dicarboxylate transport system substrate-binding protein
MKGLKVRVQQSDLWVSMLEAMGANATPMPMGEVYTGPEDRPDRRRREQLPHLRKRAPFEVAKYYSKTEHSMAPEMLLFSKRTWDKLSPEDQGWIRQAAKESVPYMRKLWDEREAKSLAT